MAKGRQSTHSIRTQVHIVIALNVQPQWRLAVHSISYTGDWRKYNFPAISQHSKTADENCRLHFLNGDLFLYLFQHLKIN